jgi:L-ribulose-5-phosphate 3-epimerase
LIWSKPDKGALTLLTRRAWLMTSGIAAVNAALATSLNKLPTTTDVSKSEEPSPACPFRLAVINDEITPDFEKACRITSKDFGLHWIELRSLWDKNVTELSEKQIDEAKKILAENTLQVTDIASPLFKTDWPGAPRSPLSETRDQFHANFDANAQDQLLEQCVSLAKAFQTDRIRCFDYWRLEDPKPYRDAINAKLKQAAERCAKDHLILLLENEMSCNTATGAESAAILKAIPNGNFMLNWDPGNAAALDGTSYDVGYALLPKTRLGHCHCKDVVRRPDHKYDWAPVGGGIVNWTGQLQALQRDGFHFGLSLETHWRGGGTPEQSSRISMDGLKAALAKADIRC